MSALNRAQAPAIKDINRFDFPVCDKTLTKKGVPFYYTKSTTDEVLRIEFVFDAGIVKQHQKLIAVTANALLTEGTHSRTAKDIADSLDFYGSYVQPRCTVDDSQLTLYCLKKHLPKCLDVVIDVLKNPLFSDNEVDIYKRNNKQRLKVQQGKTSYLCRKSFYKNIFGEESPIAYYSESIDYDKISRETLIEFHSNYYAGLKYITAAGDVNDDVITAIEDVAASFSNADTNSSYRSNNIVQGEKIVKEKSAQSTLRLGQKLFNRTHPDYRKLQLLNTILGGYFGSRLMKNIREDKGLTYGIYSVLESYLDDGCFYIEADVNSEKTELAISEINKELLQLNNNLIQEKELNTAKNYFLGSILRGIDGPFSTMDRNRILIDYDFSNDYYEEFLDIIKSTTPKELIELSNQYLKPENLVAIVCGG